MVTYVVDLIDYHHFHNASMYQDIMFFMKYVRFNEHSDCLLCHHFRVSMVKLDRREKSVKEDLL